MACCVVKPGSDSLRDDWSETELAWSKPPLCTNGELDRAGEAIGMGDLSPQHVALVDQWRASHNFPLNSFQVTLRGRVGRIASNAVVAQRLKRFRSIQAKLSRFDRMPLSQMQDIGGCRAVLPSLDDVAAAVDVHLVEGFRLAKDYIMKPKDDGYRSVHFVGRYKARFAEHECWNNRRIEVQLRTFIQHYFSTAMETATTFTGTPLKFGGGDPRWKRFFVLMGSAFALLEGTDPVEGVVADEGLISDELRQLDGDLAVLAKLKAWRHLTVEAPVKMNRWAKVFVLALDPGMRRLNIYQYSDREKADFDVRAIEADIRAEAIPFRDVVQVEAQSLTELRQAFPNYYSDTKAFLDIAARIIDGDWRFPSFAVEA